MTRSLPLAARAAAPDLVAVLDELLAPVVVAACPERAVDPEVWESVLVGFARDLLARPGKQLRARVVELAFELAVGGPRLSPVIPQLVELVHAGSLIVDDIQDDARCRRGGPALHRVSGTALAINTGNWLYFAAYHLIGRAGLPDAAALEIHRRLTRTMFHSHQGQALDLAIDVTELRQCEVTVLADAAAALKTGELMSFAAELGGLAAGAPAPVVASLARFGAALGIGLQQLDDLAGLRDPRRRDKAREDLAGRRLTWPWAYLARTLDEVRFAKLQRRLRDAGGGELDALATEVAELLGDEARRGACARLAAARAELAAAFPGHAALARVDAELARLERDAG
jgi:geranylgeranyl pyrophosphate synthase